MQTQQLLSSPSCRLRSEKVILAAEGPDKNVLIITPPLCFTCENARRLVASLDSVVTELEKDWNSLTDRTSKISMSMILPSDSGALEEAGQEQGGREGAPVLVSSNGEAEEEGDEPPSKMSRYEDVD